MQRLGFCTETCWFVVLCAHERRSSVERLIHNLWVPFKLKKYDMFRQNVAWLFTTKSTKKIVQESTDYISCKLYFNRGEFDK